MFFSPYTRSFFSRRDNSLLLFTTGVSLIVSVGIWLLATHFLRGKSCYILAVFTAPNLFLRTGKDYLFGKLFLIDFGREFLTCSALALIIQRCQDLFFLFPILCYFYNHVEPYLLAIDKNSRTFPELIGLLSL